MASIFTKIVNGEIPAYKVAEDEKHLAFLDIFPLTKGHTLVIPKKETDYLFDIGSDEHKALWEFAQKVAHRVKTAVPCERVCVVVAGYEVPHAHIHLIPTNAMSDMNFTNPKLKFSNEEFAEIAKLIREA